MKLTETQQRTIDILGDVAEGKITPQQAETQLVENGSDIEKAKALVSQQLGGSDLEEV